MPPSRPPQRLFVLAWLTLAGATPAFANDSNAALAAGGIVPVKSTTIRMVSEDLVIAPERITVTYRFRNLSDEPQRVLVAFPFARAPVGGDVEFSIPWDKPAEIFKFKVQVDGRNIEPRYETHWFDAQGREIAPMAKFEPWVSKERVEYRALWEQEYAPNQTVTVTHEYKPLLGSSMEAPPVRDLRRKFCMNTPPRGLRNYVSMNLQYILTTANTWAGPIEDFRLTVLPSQNGRYPSQRMSLCGFPLTPRKPHGYTFHARNFTPKREIDLIYLTRIQE